VRRLLIGLLVGIAALAAVGSDRSVSAQAQQPSPPVVQPVDVLQVNGLFDHIVVKSIGDAIDRAVDKHSQALVLQVDSRGAVVSDEEMAALLERVAESPVPIGVWVGPTGARLYGAPAQMLAVADVTGMAPGARVGNVGPPVSNEYPLGPGLTALNDRTVGLTDARSLAVFKQRISDEGIPTIRNMLEALDGYSENGTALETTTEVVTDTGTVQKQTVAAVRFSKLPLLDQLFHTVASPPVAYLLFLVGLALLIFEFFTAGVGIAGVVGAVCTMLACFGIAELPARWWAVALLVAAMVAFAIDVQVGIPRFWTGVGIVFVIIGSLWLFEPVSGSSLRPNWLSLIAGIGGTMLAFIVGMPSMTRTRFATPTIGREWLIGSEGIAVSAVDPDGVVKIGEAQWQARTNRATPLKAGDPLRVAAIDGVTLEVEPLEGAAKDYRERRGKTPVSDTSEGGV
jgi:membrane-bound serine protease (ClpP class)